MTTTQSSEHANHRSRNRLLWTVAGVGAAAAAYALWARPWHLKWGTTKEEAEGLLPGDALVPEPKAVATHAITIDAPVECVWPWLAQVGQDRGGFYSYTWLENLAGCNMVNAQQIHPEWQHLKAGDKVRLHPTAPPMDIAMMKENEYLVLEGGNPPDERSTWAFVLRRESAKRTRLLIRLRGNWHPDIKTEILYHGVWEPAHFIMERKMMLTLKRHAEEMARSGACVL